VVAELKKRRWTSERIHALLERYPGGVAAKYPGRLLEEIRRSFAKVENGAFGLGPGGTSLASGPAWAPGAGAGGFGGGSSPPPPPSGAAASPPPSSGGATSSSPGAGVLPTIRLTDGQLPRVVAETERAIRGAGVEAFVRAGSLVYPVSEVVLAADGGKTVAARLREFTTDSFIEPVAESAIFQRWSVRRQRWIDVDPPLTLVRMILARERRWAFPRVSGVITTPTLRADGSLLTASGYDPATELYLISGITLPAIPQAPSRSEGLAALTLLKDELFSEFAFKTKRPAIDLAVALAALLTALLRGSLPTAPIILITADTPGTGKSYLVDVIATIATGRLCPVITASRSSEETEKRIGAVLLGGSAIVSLDNVTYDLEGELLCQVTERTVVRIRVLGRSEMPECECRTAVFATGNNVGFKGDMVRRGLMCSLEALEERPELHEYANDVLARAGGERAKYVAAALTMVRAYLAAGSPKVVKPFGSYHRWSALVRSPLVWLGEPDPVDSVEAIRKEDPTLADMGELFSLWESCLKLDTFYTTSRIIELAEEQAQVSSQSPPNFNGSEFKNFLLKAAAARGSPSVVSPERLGKWLRRISGRIVGRRRLMREQDRNHIVMFRLTAV
jgi:hypothetical protein